MTRPLATLFSATPPAITSFVEAGLFVGVVDHLENDLFSGALDAGGNVGVALVFGRLVVSSQPG